MEAPPSAKSPPSPSKYSYPYSKDYAYLAQLPQDEDDVVELIFCFRTAKWLEDSLR